jgi:hypothetical protein
MAARAENGADDEHVTDTAAHDVGCTGMVDIGAQYVSVGGEASGAVSVTGMGTCVVRQTNLRAGGTRPHRKTDGHLSLVHEGSLVHRDALYYRVTRIWLVSSLAYFAPHSIFGSVDFVFCRVIAAEIEIDDVHKVTEESQQQRVRCEKWT